MINSYFPSLTLHLSDLSMCTYIFDRVNKQIHNREDKQQKMAAGRVFSGDKILT